MENIPSEPMTNINQSMNEIYEVRGETLIESKRDNNLTKINLIKKRKAKRQKKVEKIIQKWLSLQKTIKEEITLEEVILKQQDDDFNNLKELFTKYYETKIQFRQQFEIIKNLEKNIKIEKKEYKIEKDIDRMLLDASDPIRNLMFILRNNYDYITKLVSLIDETDEPENYDDLVSPCESAGTNVNSYSDCVGKSCEFIEEKCCFLESVNITNGLVEKECVDICFYDYMREDRKQQMIKDIKNGTYWDSYDGKYQEILQLNCHQVFIYPYVLFIIILFFM
jgi:hypothetical protein